MLVVEPDDPRAVDTIASWMAAQGVSVLNVAGPRASEMPGITVSAGRIVRGVLATMAP